MNGTRVTFDVDELQRLAGKVPRGRGCDFCATGTVAWRYSARNVGLGTVVYGEYVCRPVSIGDWHACADCSDLVESGDWPALARRTLRSLDVDFGRAGPGTRVKLLAVFHHAQEHFRNARCGQREAAA